MLVTFFANPDAVGFLVIMGSVFVLGVSVLGIRFTITNRKKKDE